MLAKKVSKEGKKVKRIWWIIENGNESGSKYGCVEEKPVKNSKKPGI